MENENAARRKSRVMCVGDVRIGGDNPIVVQSMTTTDTRDVDATVQQILALEAVGCEMARVAVPDHEAALKLGAIRERINTPLIADIHFNFKHAVTAIDQGVDKVRLNPGNIGGPAKFLEVMKMLKDRGVPSRIGVNSGSLEMDLIEKYGFPTSDALVESALRYCELADQAGYSDFCVSLKSSNVPMTVNAYRSFAAKTDVPLHLGVTEAGDSSYSPVKSSAGIGALLLDGLGDTIRVSILGDPTVEIPVCFDLLKATGRRVTSPEIVACPSCGRIEIDLEKIVAEVKDRLKLSRLPLVVSLLGCVVNGPGEAREADIGLAAGRGFGMIFKKGVMVRKVVESEMVDALIEEINNMESDPSSSESSLQNS